MQLINREDLIEFKRTMQYNSKLKKDIVPFNRSTLFLQDIFRSRPTKSYELWESKNIVDYIGQPFLSRWIYKWYTFRI
jgi:hypothetical protein